MQRTISRQHTVLSIIGFAFVLCGSLSTAEEPDTPPLAISIPDGIPHLEWFGEDPDTYYSLKAAPDLHSGEWRNVMTGRLGRGEVHEWVDTEEVPSGQRFYQLVPYTDLSGTTSDSGVFSFELEDAEKQVFVTDSDNRPLADISVQVQVDSDTFLVQVHDTSGGYFPAIETVDSEQDRLDVTMRERQLVPAGEEPAGLTFAETAHLLNQEDEYEFIPPDAQVEVLRGRDAEDLLDGLANLREPTWKNYALGGVKVGKAIEFIYSATKIIKTGTATNPIVFVATWGTFAMLDEMLKPELEKWFTRVNAEQGMVLMMSDETIEAYGNIAGTVTDGRGNRLSDFSVLIEDIPFANPLTEPGAYVVGSIPSSPGGTTYSVTVEPHSELSIYAPFFRSRRVLEGTDIPLTAWVSDVSPSTFDVTVKAATTAQGCVEISRTRRDDLTPVIKYRPIGSLDDWTSVPMSSGTGFDQSSFTGSVPGSVMTDPGLEVYIEVADGEDIARTPVAQYVPATSFIAIDSNPPGAQILVNGEPAGETILSLPVEKGETLNLTAHVPDSPFPVLERTVTDTEPEHRLVMFDFVGEREISVAAPTAESLEGGSTTGITWETGGDVPYVDVLYRAGDSSRWRLIANSVANNGSIDWQVPNTDMTDVRIKVRSSDDYRFQGVSPSFNVVWTSPPPSGNEGDYLVIDLSAGPNASSYPHYFLSSVPSGGWTDEYKTTKLVLRRIPAGTFIMGSPEDELMRWSNEAQRQVTLTEDFYIGVFQVTQKQWDFGDVRSQAIHCKVNTTIFLKNNGLRRNQPCRAICFKRFYG